jgi:hypothetical protein
MFTVTGATPVRWRIILRIAASWQRFEVRLCRFMSPREVFAAFAHRAKACRARPSSHDCLCRRRNGHDNLWYTSCHCEEGTDVSVYRSLPCCCHDCSTGHKRNSGVSSLRRREDATTRRGDPSQRHGRGRDRSGDARSACPSCGSVAGLRVPAPRRLRIRSGSPPTWLVGRPEQHYQRPPGLIVALLSMNIFE